MNKILLLTLFVFFTSLSYAQEIPAKANTIIITFPDSNNLHKKVSKIISDKGYTIKNADKVSSIILTEPKTVKNTRITFDAKLKGNEVFLKGQIFIAGQENLAIENKGAKGTPILNAWEEMDKLAKSLGGKLRYEILK